MFGTFDFAEALTTLKKAAHDFELLLKLVQQMDTRTRNIEAALAVLAPQKRENGNG